MTWDAGKRRGLRPRARRGMRGVGNCDTGRETRDGAPLSDVAYSHTRENEGRGRTRDEGERGTREGAPRFLVLPRPSYARTPLESTAPRPSFLVQRRGFPRPSSPVALVARGDDASPHPKSSMTKRGTRNGARYAPCSLVPRPDEGPAAAYAPYLTRGSAFAYPMSVIRFTSTNTTLMNSTAPWTPGRSRRAIAFTT